MAQTAQEIPDKSLFTIAEVARLTSTKPFVLRFWQSEFPMLQPVKAPNGRRLYRREDIEMVFEIKRLLYEEGFTIAGARKHLSNQASANPEAAEEKPLKTPVNSRAQQKFLLDLHEELLAILTLLERE
ncbi:MAG TPA: MerR family transcriptional regulator [Candidatus Acidoferrales bacterium]|nr:MerR family transcriptional regulator [Candidatus Acidoferrales bacterium]